MKADLSRLIAVYGKTPSFHDARILRLEIFGSALVMVLYVYEPPLTGLPKQEWDNDLHTICELRFSSIVSIDFRLEYNSIDSLRFEETDEGVIATFVGELTDEGGQIVSASVYVGEIQLAEERFKWRGRDTGAWEFSLKQG